MSDRFGAWFPFVLLAFLAGLTFWLDRIVQPPATTRSTEVKHDPDYIVDGLSAVRMDPQGRVKHTLIARKMTHFPDDDVTFLVMPKFVTYAEGRSPVTITSLEAHMSGNGENVYFENDVRVVRAPVANQGELVLETNYLHVIPDDNIAKTDKPVTIHSANGVVNASALELNSDTRVLNLQGRVRATFERPGTAPRNAR
ncbi:MAG TPA: LPS export ABC transporter periplasmic protein LptC [Burkholderiales bacterium]|jgi:lipopolysaccharide export system protein LptC|nr:LPS export ABC transporter periplasmic protein LptC [Burkholderiales bacterium]